MDPFLSNRRKALYVYPLIFLAAMMVVLSCGDQKATEVKSGDEDPQPSVMNPLEEKTVLPTKDGTLIYGTFIYPDDREVHPAVILCHQFKSDSSSYKNFQTLLSENGICSLAIDFRGFGESTYKELSYTNFNDQNYIDMLMDIKAALVFLQSETVQDRIDGESIGLIGASIGANLAIMAGAEIEGLKCIGALSPGRSWHGLEPLPYAPRVNIPALVGYALDDKQSAEVIPDLTEAFGENEPNVVAVSGGQHGTNMLPDGFDQTLLNWLKEQFAQ